MQFLFSLLKSSILRKTPLEHVKNSIFSLKFFFTLKTFYLFFLKTVCFTILNRQTPANMQQDLDRNVADSD